MSWTLRGLRRILSRGISRTAPLSVWGTTASICMPGRADPVPLPSCALWTLCPAYMLRRPPAALLPAIDRALARYGADADPCVVWPVSEEEDDESKTNPGETSCASADHESPSGATDGPERTASAGPTDDGAAPPPEREAEAGGSAETSPNTGESTPGQGPDSLASLTEGDEPQQAAASASPADQRASEEHTHGDPSGGGDADSPPSPSSSPSAARRPQWGGVTADLLEVEAELARAARKDPDIERDTAILQRQLRRVLRQVGVGPVGSESPRLDGRRLVRELTGRSVRLSRARRREMEPSLMLVLVDVSGSCSGSAAPACASAIRLAARDGRIAVVSHSNGHPVAVAAQADMPPRPPGHEGEIHHMPWWSELLARHTIAGTVAWGDSDAADVYQQLAAHAPLVWLDPYTARHGVRSRRQPFAGCAHYVGVSGAAAANEALRRVTKCRRHAFA